MGTSEWTTASPIRLSRHKTHFSALYFLVQPHQVQVFIRTEIRGGNRKSGLHIKLPDPLYVGRADHVHALRELRRQYRTRRHCFTVQPHAIAHRVLNGVTKGMSKIE